MKPEAVYSANVIRVPFPTYRSHKKVTAAKILSINPDPKYAPAADLTVALPSGEFTFSVSGEYVHRHNPRVGGYWVMYDDGYQSWSPAEAFEGGYTLVG